MKTLLNFFLRQDCDRGVVRHGRETACLLFRSCTELLLISMLQPVTFTRQLCFDFSACHCVASIRFGFYMNVNLTLNTIDRTAQSTGIFILEWANLLTEL